MLARYSVPLGERKQKVRKSIALIGLVSRRWRRGHFGDCISLTDTTDLIVCSAMGQYVLRTAGSCFEYRKFEWPKYDDRRVVHSSHVLSMVDAHPGGLSEGWHELHEGISPPAPLGRLLMSPASVPFHTRDMADD
jgi:hypothetical protein